MNKLDSHLSGVVGGGWGLELGDFCLLSPSCNKK